MDYCQIITYCAAEVERQGDGSDFVPRMFSAWDHARNLTRITHWSIVRLNRLITGGSNGYRTTPVTFARGGHAVDAEHVERQVVMLVENIASLTPDEFAYQFLVIHPFRDGNGRTASLLWNYLRGTIDTPEMLPEFDFV